MREQKEVNARLQEILAEVRDIKSGKELYGDTDDVELDKLEARAEELRWVLGLGK